MFFFKISDTDLVLISAMFQLLQPRLTVVSDVGPSLNLDKSTLLRTSGMVFSNFDTLTQLKDCVGECSSLKPLNYTPMSTTTSLRPSSLLRDSCLTPQLRDLRDKIMSILERVGIYC